MLPPAESPMLARSRPKPTSFATPRSVPRGASLTFASADRLTLDLCYRGQDEPATASWVALDLSSGEMIADYPLGEYH